MEPTIINKADNQLGYHCKNPIIYLADYYFVETLAPTKKTRKIKKIEHILREQLYCEYKDENTKIFFLKRFRNSLNKNAKVVKDNSTLEIEKIVLLKKIGYSDIH